MLYLRCRTCGKYVEAPAALGKGYCSETCAASFARCSNCGRFFPTGSGHDAETCSGDCAIRYAIHRSYGVTPAGALSEEPT